MPAKPAVTMQDLERPELLPSRVGFSPSVERSS
jgi:hypothetical protein